MSTLVEVSTIHDAFDFLLELGVSEQALQVATYLNGYTLETLDDVAEILFGQDIEQLRDEVIENA